MEANPRRSLRTPSTALLLTRKTDNLDCPVGELGDHGPRRLRLAGRIRFRLPQPEGSRLAGTTPARDKRAPFRNRWFLDGYWRRLGRWGIRYFFVSIPIRFGIGIGSSWGSATELRK